MKLTEVLAAAPTPVLRPHKVCAVKFAYDRLDADEADALDTLLTSTVPMVNPSAPTTYVWSHRAVSGFMIDAGLDVGDQAIARHRAGRCKCVTR